MAVSMSAMVRSYPLEYGYELNEFDPFYNFRATQYLVDNGWFAYKDWHDDRVWYPAGRDISKTSQEMQHFTAAGLYKIFGGNMTLYDFIIPLPLIFGALTSIAIFAMVRVIGGTTAGMLASMFFAISVPIISRGTIGWFKSEPIGLFYGIIGMYLFLSGMKSDSRRMALTKLVFGGVMISFALSAWGGSQFFVVPIGIFLFALPIIRKDFSAVTLRIVVFAASLLVTMAFFERGGVSAITGMVGPAIIIPTVFNVICYIIQKKWPQRSRFVITRMFVILMGTSIVGVMINTTYKIIPFGGRQLIALNPFLKSESVISQSVAEHATTTITQSFSFFSILLIFSGLGAWFLLVNRDKMKTYLPNIPFDMAVYALILSIMGVYLSSAFIRLELYTTIATSVLASIGIAIISAEVLKPRTQSKKHSKIHPTVKIAFVAVIVVLLITPTLTPVYGNWTNANRGPPTLLTGGSNVARMDKNQHSKRRHNRIMVGLWLLVNHDD